MRGKFENSSVSAAEVPVFLNISSVMATMAVQILPLGEGGLYLIGSTCIDFGVIYLLWMLPTTRLSNMEAIRKPALPISALNKSVPGFTIDNRLFIRESAAIHEVTSEVVYC